uniref:G-protein coupled receptors family 1 profile domain-containing protein n=1 Tax=Jaculus jaculus TaxID=51337 RepID=A0A8C5JUR9_JACJA
MTVHNHTTVVEFALQGFSGDPGNTLIIMAISLNPGLHTPMYFFLSNLALVLPKLLEGLVPRGSSISYEGCMIQLFFLMWFLGAELLLLTTMAFDRYVAICRPLHYSTLMSRHVCILFASSVWVVSMVSTSVHTGLMVQLHFCGSNQILHFLCEVPTLLILSFSPTILNSIMIIIADIYFGVINFLLNMMSYGLIITSILRIHSRHAFSTCSAHLVVVTLYYSTIIYTYVLPGSGSSMENGKVVALLYTDVKVALKKVFPCVR